MSRHRKFLLPAALLMVSLAMANLPAPAAANQFGTQLPNAIKIELFVRKDSERCDRALQYLQDLTARRAGFELVVHDVIEDQDQLRRLWDLAKKAGYEKPAVPMVYCCRKIHIGFDQPATTGPKIEDLFTMQVYTRSTCPRCQKAKVFLSGLQQRWPGLKITIFELTYDVAARDTWNSLSQRFRVTPGLPTVYFSGQLIVGYQGDTITGREIEALVREASGMPAIEALPPPRLGTLLGIHPAVSLLALQAPAGLQTAREVNADSLDEIPLPSESDDVPLPSESDDVPLPSESDDIPLPSESGDIPHSDDVVVDKLSGRVDDGQSESDSDIINVPLFGQLRVSALGLPAFTFLVGLIDGFNPCAMWVLIFLLSVLVNIQDRRKMIAIAGTFVVISGVAYFAFMAAWLSVFRLIGIVRPVQIALGCTAAFIGVVNIKDFFAFKKGLSFSIPESQKPGIYARVRDIVNAKYLTAAISAAIVLAIVVNIVELLCTAGLPALYTQILMMQELPSWANYCYLGLYNVAYMLDDSILLAIVVITLSKRRLQESEGRWLKLVSGVVILALGLTMIFRPTWLQMST